MRSCCPNAASLYDKDSLSEIAASVCCQGATLLTGGLGENKGFCCRATCVKRLKANGDEPITVVSGTVVSGGSEQGIDMLIPMSPAKSSCCSSGPSSCVVVPPASDDVLTVLLLALPANTWVGIKDEKLLSEILGLVSTEKLPNVLQEEVSLSLSISLPRFFSLPLYIHSLFMLFFLKVSFSCLILKVVKLVAQFMMITFWTS